MRTCESFVAEPGKAARVEIIGCASISEFKGFNFKVFLFPLFPWLWLLLLVCGNVGPNPTLYVCMQAWILYDNNRGLHDNLAELAVAGFEFDVL